MAESKDSTYLLSGAQRSAIFDSPLTIGSYTVVDEHERKPIFYAKDPAGKLFVLKMHDYIDFEEIPGHTQREMNQRCFDHECEINALLSHPNICSGQAFESGGVKYLLMPKVGECDLSKAVLDKSRKLSCLEQIASALAYCHGKGIAHLDVKMENVRVGDNAYLIDFGSARRIGEKDEVLLATISLTDKTAAPEYVNHGVFNARTDTFSFSFISYATLTGNKPFKIRADRIAYNQSVFDEKRMEEFGDAGRLIIQGLNLDNGSRPLIRELSDALREQSAKYRPQPSEPLSEPFPVLVQ